MHQNDHVHVGVTAFTIHFGQGLIRTTLIFYQFFMGRGGALMSAIETSNVRARVTAAVPWPQAAFPPGPARTRHRCRRQRRSAPAPSRSVYPVVGG